MNDFWNPITWYDNFELFISLAIATGKSTILLGFAALLCLTFRRFSASTRHLLWTLMLCASLLMPFSIFVKSWEAPILPVSTQVRNTSEASESGINDSLHFTPDAQSSKKLSSSLETNNIIKKNSEFKTNAELSKGLQLTSRTLQTNAQPQKEETTLFQQSVNWILIVWIAGILLLLFRLLMGMTATNFLARRATEFKDFSLNELFSSLKNELNLKSKVRLLRSECTLMPVVCGVFRPVVLLPANADDWSKERQRMVLLHELTHVARRDCLTQLLAQTACAFYWFNPLVWYAARRLRVEREQACDDFVLSVGTKPSDYAHHLLEIARALQENSAFKWSQTATVAMARQSQLENRLLSILRNEGKRQTMSRLMTVTVVALAGVLLVPLALIRPIAMNAQNSQSSKNASNSETEIAKRTLPGSFQSLELGAQDEMRRNDAKETIRKQESSIAANDNLHNKQALTDAQIEADVERGVENRGVEHNAKQDASEKIAPQDAISPQTPEFHPQPQEINSFINAKNEPEIETQEKSGDFIDEMASAGYTNLTIDELIKLKTSGVTADYVKNLRALGFANLSTKELSSMKVHGVIPAYIQAIGAAGYNDLSARDLTAFRIHDVTPEYIRTLRDAGYGNLAAKQLIDFAIHRVTAAFINGVRAAGYGNLSPRELVSLRIYGVNPEFIRKARSRLGELTLKQIISLKNSGGIDDDKGKDKEKDKEKEQG